MLVASTHNQSLGSVVTEFVEKEYQYQQEGQELKSCVYSENLGKVRTTLTEYIGFLTPSAPHIKNI